MPRELGLAPQSVKIPPRFGTSGVTGVPRCRWSGPLYQSIIIAMELVENVNVQLVGGVIVMNLDIVNVEVVKMVSVDMVGLVMKVVDHGSWEWVLTHWLRPW